MSGPIVNDRAVLFFPQQRLAWLAPGAFYSTTPFNSRIKKSKIRWVL